MKMRDHRPAESPNGTTSGPILRSDEVWQRPCEGCLTPFTYANFQRGRPPIFCPECRDGSGVLKRKLRLLEETKAAALAAAEARAFLTFAVGRLSAALEDLGYPEGFVGGLEVAEALDLYIRETRSELGRLQRAVSAGRVDHSAEPIRRAVNG